MKTTVWQFACAAIAFGTLSLEAQAEVPNCHLMPFGFVPGQTVDVEMTVRSGKRCGIILTNSAGGVTGIRIVKPASTGSATVQGTKVSYAPQAGRTGADAFAYAVDGKDVSGRDQVFGVAVHVSIIP